MKVARKATPAKQNIAVAMRYLSENVLRVGWFESSRYPDGTPVAYVAMIQEYGSPAQGIPPRPFLRPTVVRDEAHWKELLMQACRKISKGQITAEQTLRVIALQVQGDIALSIAKVDTPPLAPETIAARLRRYKSPAKKGAPTGVSKPLVDTSRMVSSISHTVGAK